MDYYYYYYYICIYYTQIIRAASTILKLLQQKLFIVQQLLYYKHMMGRKDITFRKQYFESEQLLKLSFQLAVSALIFFENIRARYIRSHEQARGAPHNSLFYSCESRHPEVFYIVPSTGEVFEVVAAPAHCIRTTLVSIPHRVRNYGR